MITTAQREPSTLRYHTINQYSTCSRDLSMQTWKCEGQRTMDSQNYTRAREKVRCRDALKGTDEKLNFDG